MPSDAPAPTFPRRRNLALLERYFAKFRLFTALINCYSANLDKEHSKRKSTPEGGHAVINGQSNARWSNIFHLKTGEQRHSACALFVRCPEFFSTPQFHELLLPVVSNAVASRVKPGCSPSQLHWLYVSHRQLCFLGPSSYAFS